MDTLSVVVDDETRGSIHEQHDTFQDDDTYDEKDDDNDDKYTVASTASTVFTMGSNYSAATDNYIPMSRLSSRQSFKLRTTSSFPSILNLYHHPIQEEGGEGRDDGIIKRKERHRDDDRLSKKADKPKVDWDTVIENRTRHEQRAIRIETVAREQMVKYEKYISNLKMKVEQQRESRRKQYEDIKERLRQKEEEDKRRRFLVLKRPKLEYVHDRKYLKKLPQSKFTKMVLLSDDLQRRGVLSNRTDIDRFWNDLGKGGPDNDIIAPRDPLKQVQDSNEWIGRRLTGPPPPRKDTYGRRAYGPLPPVVYNKKKKRSSQDDSVSTGTENVPSIYVSDIRTHENQSST